MKTTLPDASQSHKKYIEGLRFGLLKHFEDKVAMVILFGSFARGDWVLDDKMEDHINYVYASDYDLLVITKTNKQGSASSRWRLEREMQEKIEPYGHSHRPHYPNVIVESPKRVNQELETRQYFFSDIIKEGVLLYDSGDVQLAEPRELKQSERKEIAKEYFEQWFESGMAFLQDHQTAYARSDYRRAAFYLHQSTEAFLNCALLVLTGYKPKTHSIKRLTQLCASQSSNFLSIFPTATAMEQEALKKLEHAYVDARYEKDYQISQEQLEYLIRRVEVLRDITQEICQQHLRALAR